MKSSPTMGEVNPDSIRRLVLTVETEEDAALLAGLHHLFRYRKGYLSDCERLALAVLCQPADRTVRAMLLDEVGAEAGAELAAEDRGERRYLSRTDLLRLIRAVESLNHSPLAYSQVPVSATPGGDNPAAVARVPQRVWLAVLDLFRAAERAGQWSDGRRAA